MVSQQDMFFNAYCERLRSDLQYKGNACVTAEHKQEVALFSPGHFMQVTVGRTKLN